jgi:hypothetical protein
VEEVTMAQLEAWDARSGADAHRLEAEIANEPQWVVFDGAAEEDEWAAHQAATVTVAAWWAGAHA